MPNGDLMPAVMKHKRERMRELTERIERDDLSSTKEEEIEAELRKESKFQYQFFERGLSDGSIDAEKLAEHPLYEGFEAEEIKKSQEAWSEAPLEHHKMPVIVDKMYAVSGEDES